VGSGARQPLEGYTYHIYSVHITYNNYVLHVGWLPFGHECNHAIHIYLITNLISSISWTKWVAGYAIFRVRVDYSIQRRT